MTKRTLALVLAPPLLAASHLAQAFCGPPLHMNHWGRPADFRDPSMATQLDNVERNHFNPDVENLVQGQHGPLPGDIHYTLLQFVNHHRALQSMATWQLKHPRQPRDEFFPADCYFERALAFKPDDPVVHMIWGNYLLRQRELDRAETVYLRAEELAPGDPEVLYNLGLLYVQLKDLDKAKAYAERAYAKRYPLPGLYNKLRRAGIELDLKSLQQTAAANGAVQK